MEVLETSGLTTHNRRQLFHSAFLTAKLYYVYWYDSEIYIDLSIAIEDIYRKTINRFTIEFAVKKCVSSEVQNNKSVPMVAS